MIIYEQKSYIDQNGIRILEIIEKGSYEHAINDDDKDKATKFECKFLGIIPKPIMVDQMALNIGGKVIGLPIMAIKDGFVPLKSQTVAEAFVEFIDFVQQMEKKLQEQNNKPQLIVPNKESKLII